MRCPACKMAHDKVTELCPCGTVLTRTPALLWREPAYDEEWAEVDDGPSVAVLPAGTHAATFHGSGSTLLGMHASNTVRTLLTMGVYYFWAKALVRCYVYNQTSFAGDRFTFHGTGQELLQGWLKVAGIFGALTVLGYLTNFAGDITLRVIVDKAGFALVSLFLFPVAVVGAQRYRLSRTSWRGIRFSFRGHAKEFLQLCLGGLARSVLTLGFYLPYLHNDARRFLTQHTHFGNVGFTYDGEGRDLQGPFLLMALLFVPTLGLSWFGYRAFRERYCWAHTQFAGATFVCTVTARPLFGFWVAAWMAWICTFGLAKPWVDVARARYMVDNLRVVGELNLDTIVQNALMASAGGEGLTDFLEMSFLDIEVGI